MKELWTHFDALRSIKARDWVRILEKNRVSISLPRGSTQWNAVHAIASKATCPFSVKFVSERLKEHKLPRGGTHFGLVGDEIQKVMANYPTLRWWIEPEGLVIDEPSIDLGRLQPFDRLAGPLVQASWAGRRLPQSELMKIVKQLDAEGFQLKDCLQPAQWSPIAAHNQKNGKRAIRTFEAAAGNKRFVRPVRKRLCLARERYLKARRSVAPIDEAY